MQFFLLIKGYFLGVSVAMTVGVGGVLCLRNMISSRASVGVASALALCFADTVSAAIVVFGLQKVQYLLLSFKTATSIVAGIVLCFLGIVQLFDKVSFEKSHDLESNNVIKAFFSVFFLALIDPVSILDFLALTIGFSIDFTVLKDTVSFLMGVFLGSATWWFSWCCLIIVFRKKVSVYVLQWAWYLSNSIVFGLGLWMLHSVVNG